MKLKKIIAALSAQVMLLGTAGIYASAEEKPDWSWTYETTVVAVCGDEVWLSDSCVLYQEEFQERSGESFSLKYGDVIEVSPCCILETFPSQYEFSGEGGIRYLGTAADYYADNIKELTVIEKADKYGEVKLKDNSGTEFSWGSVQNHIKEMWGGYKPEVDEELLNPGDKLNCVMEMKETHLAEGPKEKEFVLLPLDVKSSEIVYGDSDGNGKVNIRDAAFISSALALGKADELPENSDYNLDGNINARDAAAIARSLAIHRR